MTHAEEEMCIWNYLRYTNRNFIHLTDDLFDRYAYPDRFWWTYDG